MICKRRGVREAFEASPLGAFVREYLRDHTMVAGSRRKFVAECAEFAAFVAARKGRPAEVGDLDRPAVHDWMDSLPLAPATVNSKRGTIVALANYAADECGLIPPLKRIKKMVVGTDPPDSWSAEEYSALLHAAGQVEGEWHGVPAWLCWEFGIRLVTEACCRFGELWAARVEDVDLERRIWLSRARDRKGRRQGLRHQFTERTAELIRMSLDQSDWLVESPRTRLWPFPYCKETQWVHFKRLLTAAGLSATNRDAWHKLRRTGESFLAAEVGVELAAAYAGHTPEVARKHYIDACRGEERGFADVIAEKLESQKPPPLKLFSVG